MTARVNKQGDVVIKQITNECQLDDVHCMAEQSGCGYVQKDYGCSGIVSGTKTQISAFIKLWNN